MTYRISDLKMKLASKKKILKKKAFLYFFIENGWSVRSVSWIEVVLEWRVDGNEEVETRKGRGKDEEEKLKDVKEAQQSDEKDRVTVTERVSLIKNNFI